MHPTRLATLVAGIMLPVLVLGCGKSEEEKQRESWEKAFKAVGEAIGESITADSSADDHGLTLVSRRFIHHDGRTVCWEITNLWEDPVTIQRVAFNGEWDAPIADWSWLPSMPKDPNGQYPKTLTIGETLRVFYKSMYANDRSYWKQIIYIDLYTDRGDFRYRPFGGFEVLDN